MKGDKKLKKTHLTYLITDTLPNELPIIYSNKDFYKYIKDNITEWNKISFRNIEDTKKNIRFTVPTQFEVKKNDYENRTISLMHPYSQAVCTKFIESYTELIIDYFKNNSVYSIRKPISINDTYSPNMKSQFEKEIETILDSEICTCDFFNEMYIKTFFSLSKFPKITDFFRSYKVKDLELKYHFMRRIDIKTCFDTIYTHSIDWAYLGDKSIAKDLLNNTSLRFSALFDRVTQSMNYNETNGILIGPEYSRLVAELILTRIDRCIYFELNELNINNNIDYEIIRFVDDYFIFFNNHSIGDEIQKVISSNLGKYKFSINSKKVVDENRPFLKKHTWVIQLKHSLNSLFEYMEESNIECSRLFMDFYNDVRLLIINYEEQQGFIVSYALSTIENRIDEIIELINECEQEQNILKSFLNLIDVLIYILNYSISSDNVIKICRMFLKIQNDHQSDNSRIEDIIFKKCFTMLKYNKSQHTELLNIYCLLINNSNLIPNEFLISNVDDTYLTLCTIIYYVIHKDKKFYNDTIKEINILVDSIIEKMRVRYGITSNNSSDASYSKIDDAICSKEFILLHDIYASGILGESNHKKLDQFRKKIIVKKGDEYLLYNLFLNYIKGFDRSFINWNMTYEESIQEMYIRKYSKFNSYEVL